MLENKLGVEEKRGKRGLKTTLAEMAKGVSANAYWSLMLSDFVEALLDPEGVVDAAELAAAFPGHQPLDCLHPTNADVDVKHKINKANFRVFMNSISCLIKRLET